MTAQILLRFYEELNDYLTEERRRVCFAHPLQPGRAVETVLAELNVPRDQVELCLVNGVSVDFSHRLHGGERLSVYPAFEAFDVSTEIRVRARPLRQPRFVLDVHLGKLARYLRMCGFDAIWQVHSRDEELVRLSYRERRILLSKDREVLRHGALTHAYRVRAVKAREQLEEVLARFDLYRLVQPFVRCMRCNQLLERVDDDRALRHVDAAVRARHQEFRHCPLCGRVYWEGSHVAKMRVFIQTVMASSHGKWREHGPPTRGDA